MILAGLFIVLVVVLAWFALDRVKERIQADVSDALQIVLQTTQESLNLWAENKKFDLSQLAADPHLVSLVERLLQSPRDRDTLLKSRELRELRKFFQSNKDRFGKAGFFVIAPDFINLASMRNSNIGTKNLIAENMIGVVMRVDDKKNFIFRYGSNLTVHPGRIG